MDVTFSAVITMSSTCSIETQTEQVIVSPVRNLCLVFVNPSSKSEMATLHTYNHNEYSMEQSFKGSGVPDVTVPHGSVDVTFNAVITVHLHCRNSNGASDCVASAILYLFYISLAYTQSVLQVTAPQQQETASLHLVNKYIHFILQYIEFSVINIVCSFHDK